MRTISEERFLRSIEVAKQICPRELLGYICPELISDPRRNIYDSRIIRIAAFPKGHLLTHESLVEVLIEGPMGDECFELKFSGAVELSAASLNLVNLPDLLTLEFEKSSDLNLCRFHFTSTDQELLIKFKSVSFTSSPFVD